ncbi:MAG: porin family protein [Bacteroidales bacterium]|nr:porin family protein [Bacteroidales bacterium]
MKKLSVLFIAMFCLFSFTANAQITGGATLGLQAPIGDFADAANMGVGINLFGKYMLNDNMAVGANLGFNRFGAEDFGWDEMDFKACYSMIPVTGLFEYHFGGNSVKPYVGADLGIYRFGMRVKYDGESESESELYFGLAPVAGITYDINETLKFCANLKLHNVFAEGESLSWIGINAGVVIPLN